MRATIYNASAGSGKTYRLAYKYVRDVIAEPKRYRHILAVTFTNKATEEMKSRILAQIHILASGGDSGYLAPLIEELDIDEQTVRARAKQVRALILHNYSRFTVLTIDTFFQRILRAFIQELGLDFGYNIELESSSILEKSADELIEDLIHDEQLRRWLMEFIEERVEQGKRWNIKEGVLSLGGEIFKEANRESLNSAHKKEELRRIMELMESKARSSQEQYRQLATRGNDLINANALEPSDFAGKSTSFAYIFPRAAAGEIVEPKKRVRQMSAASCGWSKDGRAEALTAQLQPLLEQMVAIYDREIRNWNTTALVRENFRSFALLADLYAKVQLMCERENMMLLSESKLILSKFIEDNDAPFIYEKVGNRFERYMIDEFQDTSLKEWGNFLPLLLNGMASSEDNSVLIVGDVKQSIYRWRGGDWRILHSAARTNLGEECTETINMDDNYRSLPAIVEFNNRVIESVVQSENRTLNEQLAAARESGNISLEVEHELKDMVASAYQGHAQHPRKRAESEGYIEVSCYDDEPPIVECIKGVIDRGFSPSDIMILTRTKSEGAKVASELLRFKGVNSEPQYNFEIMTQEALIIGLAPVSGFVCAVLRLALNPEACLERAIYNNFLGAAYIDLPIDTADMAFLASIKLLSPEEAFEQIVMYYRLGEGDEHNAYLQAIHEQIISFTASRVGDIALFLKWWDERGSKASLSFEGSDRAIEITTIHKAKGLEKSVVMIPYCCWSLDPKASGVLWAEDEHGESDIGRFPVRYKKMMGESLFAADYLRERIYSHIDNINILYVALTRAAESLHIFIPNKSANIGDIVLDALGGGKEGCSIGTPAPPIARTKQQGGGRMMLDSYATAPTELKLRLPAERYCEDGSPLSPRDMGILMHRAFELAQNEGQIYERLDAMLLSSVISPEEHAELRAKIEVALTDGLVRGWFSADNECVKVETEIILPASAGSYRPDRVIINGGEVTVVDYKFGSLHRNEHLKQLRRYISLIGEMGYGSVKGYLWYIRSGEIVEG